MKYLIASVLILFSFNTKADYVLEEINTLSKEIICGADVKPMSTIVIFSNGGELAAAYDIGKCIIDKKLKLQVMKAVSAAPYLIFFSDDVCLVQSADIATHTPYVDPNNVTLDDTRTTLLALIQTLVGVAKVKLEVALEFSAYMFMVPSTQIGTINNLDYTRMLGSKYKGICTDIKLK